MKRLTSICITACIWSSFLYAADTSETTILQSSGQCFTSFLMSPAVQPLPEKIPSVSACREGAASPFGGVWMAVSGRSPKMVEPDEPGIYAACIKLVPSKQGAYTFRFGSYADGIAYFKGKEIARFPPHFEYWVNSTEFTVRLPASGAHLLFVFGSRFGRSGIFLSSNNRSVVAKLALTDTPLRKEKLAVASLACRPDRRFIGRGQTLRLSIRREAGLPSAVRDMNVHAVFRSVEGKTLYSTEKKTYNPSGADIPSVSFSWKPGSISVCKAAADVIFKVGNTAVGTITQNVYFPDTISKRISLLSSRLKQEEFRLGRPLPLACLALEKARILNRKKPRTDAVGTHVIETIENVPLMISAARRGLDVIEGKTGYIERAYFSPVDNSCQPFRMYIPSGYRRGHPVPLFIYLHGYVPSYTKADWVDEPLFLTRLMEKHTCILGVPFGRSNTDFQTVGEIDVMRVISEIRKKYTVNGRRIYIIGYSMGGSGMWTIMQHYPDRFAAGISIGGRTDYYLWKEIDRGTLPPFKQLCIDNNNPVCAPGNFTNKAFRIFHGEKDPLVKIGHSVRMHRILQENGTTSSLTVIPDRMHWIAETVCSDHGIAEWALRHELPEYPKRVDFTSYTPKYRKCFWAEITSFAEYGKPAKIFCEYTGSGFRVTRSNVSGFRLALPSTMRKKPFVTLTVNGTEQKCSVKQGGYVEVGTSDREKQTKNRMPGPFKEVFNAPFTVVYGSSFSKKSCRDKARAFISEWEQFAKGSPPVISSKNITDAYASERNLVFFSDPVQGSYLARILEKTPVRITPSSYIVGPKTFRSKGRGFAFVYPHPEHPERYIAVFSGLRWGTSLPVNHKFDHVPDFIVFSEKTNRDGSNQAAAAGFFDMEWKFSKRLLFVRQDRR